MEKIKYNKKYEIIVKSRNDTLYVIEQKSNLYS